MFIYTLAISQVDTSDLELLNIKDLYSYDIDSSWLENHIISIDNKELDFISSLDSTLLTATNHQFIHAIIHVLLKMRNDSGYQIIIKHLKSKGYHRPSSPLADTKYPVIDAILSADKSHLPFFREFLLKSNYFESEIDQRDIFFYRTLFLSGNYQCDKWIVPFKPSATFRTNLQAILDTHVIFNY